MQHCDGHCSVSGKHRFCKLLRSNASTARGEKENFRDILLLFAHCLFCFAGIGFSWLLLSRWLHTEFSDAEVCFIPESAVRVGPLPIPEPEPKDIQEIASSVGAPWHQCCTLHHTAC